MSDKPKEDNWSKDLFTKMLQEFGEKIIKISEENEKKIREEILKLEHIDTLEKTLSKKSDELKKVMEKVLTENSTFSPILGYDIDDTTIDEDDIIEEPDDIDKFNYVENNSDDELNIGDKETELSKKDIQLIGKIANPHIKEAFAKLGSNIINVAAEILLKGPGLVNLDIFAGVGEHIKQALSDTYVNFAGRLYDNDYKFRKAYDYVSRYFSRNRTKIADQMLKLAEKIKNKHATVDEINVFKATFAIFSILCSGNYQSKTFSELAKVHKQGKYYSKVCREFLYKLDALTGTPREKLDQAAELLLNMDPKDQGFMAAILFLVSVSVGSFNAVDFLYKRNNRIDQKNSKFDKFIEEISTEPSFRHNIKNNVFYFNNNTNIIGSPTICSLDLNNAKLVKKEIKNMFVSNNLDQFLIELVKKRRYLKSILNTNATLPNRTVEPY